MKLNELAPAPGAISESWRRGQGPGSGNGKTAGRGSKGQLSRSGSSMQPGFEGGQVPLHRRLPKRGFTNLFRRRYAVLNVDRLDKLFPQGGEITLETAAKRGLIKGQKMAGLKLLGGGEVTQAFVIHAHKASAQAVQKIEAAGGRVVLVASKAEAGTAAAAPQNAETKSE